MMDWLLSLWWIPFCVHFWWALLNVTYHWRFLWMLSSWVFLLLWDWGKRALIFPVYTWPRHWIILLTFTSNRCRGLFYMVWNWTLNLIDNRILHSLLLIDCLHFVVICWLFSCWIQVNVFFTLCFWFNDLISCLLVNVFNNTLILSWFVRICILVDLRSIVSVNRGSQSLGRKQTRIYDRIDWTEFLPCWIDDPF